MASVQKKEIGCDRGFLQAEIEVKWDYIDHQAY